MTFRSIVGITSLSFVFVDILFWLCVPLIQIISVGLLRTFVHIHFIKMDVFVVSGAISAFLLDLIKFLLKILSCNRVHHFHVLSVGLFQLTFVFGVGLCVPDVCIRTNNAWHGTFSVILRLVSLRPCFFKSTHQTWVSVFISFELVWKLFSLIRHTLLIKPHLFHRLKSTWVLSGTVLLLGIQINALLNNLCIFKLRLFLRAKDALELIWALLLIFVICHVDHMNIDVFISALRGVWGFDAHIQYI